MRTAEDIAAEIAVTGDPDRQWAKLAGLAAEIERHPDGVQIVPAVFALYERFPGSDFGLPGPLAHAIETHYGKDYVRLLTESLQRRPTEQTLFLAQRVLNARDQFHLEVLAALRAIALRPEVDPMLRDEAASILGTLL